MKRTCTGCKAEVRINKILRCEFGYLVKHIKSRGVYMGIVPMEECPKPKTWNEYYLQMKLKIKEG